MRNVQYERGKPYVMYESDHKVQYSMNQKKKERNLVLLTFLPILPLLFANLKRREEAFSPNLLE